MIKSKVQMGQRRYVRGQLLKRHAARQGHQSVQEREGEGGAVEQGSLPRLK